MKDKLYDLLRDGTIYQFVLLFALIVFQAIYMIITKGQVHELLLGGLLGVLTGLPSINKQSNVEKK